MRREMCPSCRTAQNMHASTTTRKVTGNDGKKREIRTLSLHCAQCNQFVRSEDLKEGSDGPSKT